MDVRVQNRSEKNQGKRSIWFNGAKKDKTTGETIEYCKKRFEKYIAKDFQRLIASIQSLIQ